MMFVADRKSESRALPHGFGGEKGLKDFVGKLLGDAGAAVADLGNTYRRLNAFEW